MEFKELECFVVLSEELHFARTAERLYLSPGRVSQLMRSLESRIGARLFHRTSRRVRLTPLGERFLSDLRPAYDGLASAVGRAKAAAREVTGVLRVGFLASPTDVVTGSVRAFESRHPGCEVELVEIPLSDPFGRLREGRIDLAFTLLPVDEPDLATGEGLNRVSYELGVSVRHPWAGRAGIDAEELARHPPDRARRPRAPRLAGADHALPDPARAGDPQGGYGVHGSGGADPGGARPGWHAVLRADGRSPPAPRRELRARHRAASVDTRAGLGQGGGNSGDPGVRRRGGRASGGGRADGGLTARRGRSRRRRG
ncbi:LysR family transcriptional regulator [Nonomuraea ferruginea]